MRDEVKRTLFNFMENPSIVGTSKKYKDIITRNRLKPAFTKWMQGRRAIPFSVFRDEKKDEWLYQFKIESETEPEISYDVVLKFTTNEPEVKAGNDLSQYEVKFFSNSPGFSYTFAYVYNKHGILVPELHDKVSPQALSEKPIRTNKELAVGYDYTLFFAMYYLQLNSSYLRKSNMVRIAKDMHYFNPDTIASTEMAMSMRSESEQRIGRKVEKAVRKNIIKPAERAAKKVEKTVTSLTSRFSSKAPIKKAKRSSLASRMIRTTKRSVASRMIKPKK